MNASALSSALTCIFFIFLILGFLYGLWRGFSKSLTRIFVVIAVAVASFFVVPKLSSALLTADISSFNLVVKDVPVQNIQQFIVDFLSSFDKINDLMNASPTITQFVQVLPQILVNVVMFILFFFIAKMLSMIIYWILCAILFPKKKMENKNKHRFIGGIIGAIQGLLVAVLILMPVFGIVNLSTQAQTAIEESEENIAQSASSSDQADPATFNGFIAQPSEDESTSDESTKALTDIVFEYNKALENNFIYKTLKSVGIIKLSNVVFDELTTVEVNTDSTPTEYKLTVEAVEISRIYPYVDQVINSEEFDITDNAFVDKIILLVDQSQNSPLISEIVHEIVNEAATRWTDLNKDRSEREFLGIAVPDLGDSDLNDLLDRELGKLKDAEKETIHETLVGILKVAQVANTTQKITEEIKGEFENISLENIKTETITELFENIVSNDVVKDLVVEVVTPEKLKDFGLDEDTSEMVSDVVTSIVNADPETLEKEISATQEIFTLSEKIMDVKGTDDKVVIENVDTLVDSIASSTVITNLIVTKIEDPNDNVIKNLNISSNIEEETKNQIESAVEEKLNNQEIDEDVAAMLEKIFGISVLPQAE